jgi:hypothetical protein
MDTDEEWVEDEDVPNALNAKIQALKVCRNRCLAHAATDTALDVSAPVLKMFVTLLECSGSFSAEADDEYVLRLSLRGCNNIAEFVVLNSRLACGFRQRYLCYTSQQWTYMLTL